MHGIEGLSDAAIVFIYDSRVINQRKQGPLSENIGGLVSYLVIQYTQHQSLQSHIESSN